MSDEETPQWHTERFDIGVPELRAIVLWCVGMIDDAQLFKLVSDQRWPADDVRVLQDALQRERPANWRSRQGRRGPYAT